MIRNIIRLRFSPEKTNKLMMLNCRVLSRHSGAALLLATLVKRLFWFFFKKNVTARIILHGISCAVGKLTDGETPWKRQRVRGYSRWSAVNPTCSSGLLYPRLSSSIPLQRVSFFSANSFLFQYFQNFSKFKSMSSSPPSWNNTTKTNQYIEDSAVGVRR